MGEDYEDEKERALKRYREIISTLPKQQGWSASEKVYQYEGFWIPLEASIEAIMWTQQYFKPRREEVLLATLPKSGTTWFKPLLFSIMNRTHYDDLATQTHPVLTTPPHDLVPSLEGYLHRNIRFPVPNNPDDDDPQLFHTHIPFTSFSQPMIDSQCRIVYVCRNPKDVLVSLFYFLQKLRNKNLPPISLEMFFERFCEGTCSCGPFWNHVLGFWKASLEWPERVMFVKYEDMKKDPSFHLKRLAEFVGYPFSVEEEKQGVVDGILEMCSFENLRNLKTNKRGAAALGIISIENHTFFRKGEVGDWKRHLTAEMAERLDKIVEQKLTGSGLTFLDSL